MSKPMGIDPFYARYPIESLLLPRMVKEELSKQLAQGEVA